MDTHERSILLTTCYGHFMSHFNVLVFPALLVPLSERLNLSMADTLGLSFWMYLFFGITALPWGLAADRWGAKPFMHLFYLGSGLSALAAAIWIDFPFRLMLALSFLGLFSGIYHPTGLGLISKGIERISLAMGYNGMFGNLGLAAAPLITGFLYHIWGPSAAYIWVAIMNVFGILFMQIFPITSIRGASVQSDEGVNTVFKPFLLLLVAMMMGGIAYRGVTVVTPAYFEMKTLEIRQWMTLYTGWHLSPNLVATSAAALIYLVGIGGQYTGGRCGERYDPRWCYLMFSALTVPMAMTMGSTSDLPLLFVSILYFFFLLGIQPLENTLIANLSPKKFHHSAYGTKFILTFGVGSIAVKGVGIIERHTGIEMVFTMIGMLSLCLSMTVVFLIFATRQARR